MPFPSSLTPLLTPRNVFPGSKLLWRSGAILAAVGMMAGAFGSHSLKRKQGITNENINTFRTAAHYAIFNGLALLLVSLHPRFAVHKFAGPAIGIGGTIFSGTIMALVLNQERFRFLGPITPVGGVLMMAGYIALAF